VQKNLQADDLPLVISDTIPFAGLLMSLDSQNYSVGGGWLAAPKLPNTAGQTEFERQCLSVSLGERSEQKVRSGIVIV
jgi:hypothetical protein